MRGQTSRVVVHSVRVYTYFIYLILKFSTRLNMDYSYTKHVHIFYLFLHVEFVQKRMLHARICRLYIHARIMCAINLFNVVSYMRARYF